MPGLDGSKLNVRDATSPPTVTTIWLMFGHTKRNLHPSCPNRENIGAVAIDRYAAPPTWNQLTVRPKAENSTVEPSFKLLPNTAATSQGYRRDGCEAVVADYSAFRPQSIGRGGGGRRSPNVWPATVSVPVRAAVVAFAATV
jgi:hypothetical protein